MRPVGVAKKRKKGQKLSCVKLAICPDHPRRRSPLKFCVRGCVREVVIYFSFMKIGPGVSELWGVENRPLPLRPMAYTTACTTVQAVIMYVCTLAQGWSVHVSVGMILCCTIPMHAYAERWTHPQSNSDMSNAIIILHWIVLTTNCDCLWRLSLYAII